LKDGKQDRHRLADDLIPINLQNHLSIVQRLKICITALCTKSKPKELVAARSAATNSLGFD